MKHSNSTVSICIIIIVLFFAGFACNKKETASTTNTTPTATPATTPATTESSPTTAFTAPKDISGEYTVTGTNEDGAGDYKGDLVVTKRDEVYQFSWNTAGKTYDGVGVQTENAVGVAFTEGTNGKGCGVILYKIRPDGALDGTAGYWGVNKSETEQAQPAGSGSRTDIGGEYDVRGTNPDGQDYTGKLNIKADGAGYTFNWNAGGEFEGFGVKQGDKVAVGLGGKQCGFVSYEIKPDGVMQGKWGGYGSKTVGTETAKKK